MKFTEARLIVANHFPEKINLNLVSFTNGIDFTFPSINLAPGEHIVVVQDRNAFKARYGTSINIAGQYSGRLENAEDGWIHLKTKPQNEVLKIRLQDIVRAKAQIS